MTYKRRGYCVGPLSPSAGGDDASPAYALPDPAGADLTSLAVLAGLGQRVCGRGGVVLRHQVSVVGHEVAPELVVVVRRGGQEELHPGEDVQQGLERKHNQDQRWEAKP